jgi:uncharacterized protein YjlB
VTQLPDTLRLAPGRTMPNSDLPVLIYRTQLSAGSKGFDAVFAANGWSGIWRNGVYDFDHFHSNAHEVLGIQQGWAALQLGGDDGQRVEVGAGDVLVLPAGTGHRRLGASPDLVVIGAYPRGQEDYDLCRERGPEEEARIAEVKLPETDPVHGAGGPLLSLWA